MEYFSLTYYSEKIKYVSHNQFYSFLQVKQYIFIQFQLWIYAIILQHYFNFIKFTSLYFTKERQNPGDSSVLSLYLIVNRFSEVN